MKEPVSGSSFRHAACDSATAGTLQYRIKRPHNAVFGNVKTARSIAELAQKLSLPYPGQSSLQPPHASRHRAATSPCFRHSSWDAATSTCLAGRQDMRANAAKNSVMHVHFAADNHRMTRPHNPCPSSPITEPARSSHFPTDHKPCRALTSTSYLLGVHRKCPSRCRSGDCWKEARPASSMGRARPKKNGTSEVWSL